MLTRLGWFVFWLLVTVILAASVCLYHLSQAAAEPDVKRLILKHGLYDSVVFIKWDNTEWFMRDGKLCRFR